jgi:hypothetical protein
MTILPTDLGSYNTPILLSKYLSKTFRESISSSPDNKRLFLEKFCSFYGKHIRRFILYEIKFASFEIPKSLFDMFIEDFLASNKAIDFNDVNKAVFSLLDEFDKFCKIYAPHISQEMIIKIFNRDPSSPYILFKNLHGVYYDSSETNAIRNQINKEKIEKNIKIMQEYLKAEPRCILYLSNSGRMNAWLHRWEEALDFHSRAYNAYVQDFNDDLAFFRSSLGMLGDGSKESILLNRIEDYLALGRLEAAKLDASIIIEKDLKSLPELVQNGLSINASILLMKFKSFKSEMAENNEPSLF